MSASRQLSTCASRPGAAHHALCLILLGMTCLTGCGGCTKQTPAQQAAKKQKDAEAELEARKKKLEEEKKKQPFLVQPLTPMLSEELVSTDEGASLRLAKPGHWTTTVQATRANLDNFEGRITCTVVDGRGRAVPLPHTPYQMTSSRPAVLVKGRTKRVENEVLVPTDSNRVQIRTTLTNRINGAEEHATLDHFTVMPSHQYFILVLAREPSRYAYLKVADSIRAPFEDENGQSPPHYRVVLADATKALPLPTNVLTWTSVAYIIWDEVNLDRLNPDQQAALVDWIHWGGRLIINGPDSLDGLRSSFLADYLPVDLGERVTFEAIQLSELSDRWTPPGKSQDRPLSVTRPWSGVELKPREGKGAVALPGADELFYECPVGAGSVVVSAIQLGERDLVNWPGYDAFLNGALLRRPSRQFSAEQDGAWAGLQTRWAEFEERTHDAYFTTPLRWFARDAGTKANSRTTTAELQPNDPAAYNPWGGYTIPETQVFVDRPSGLGGWSEFTPVSQVAREALATAAGVRVPGAGFVVACLAVYLVVLVPLNWMVFNALGRVEWAWISAPLIALAGTLAVVRQAQLDIGFVRSQTEIGLLELQGDHARGHLSRYTAIYSSLSSVYDMEFADGSSVATPFPRDNQWNPAIGDSLETVAFEKYDQPRLRGVAVTSATTQMIHSEEMIKLKGPIRMVSPGNTPQLKQIENKSGFHLSDVVVLHRNVSDNGETRLEGCWIGQLRDGAAALLRHEPITLPKDALPFASDRAKAAEIDTRKRLNVDSLLNLAFRFAPKSDPHFGERDEWRLVGRIDEVLPGSSASPEASQAAGSTVVLAHLAYEPAPFPEGDVNSPSDVLQDGRRNAYDDAYDESMEEPPPE